jgi:hypothetical protein
MAGQPRQGLSTIQKQVGTPADMAYVESMSDVHGRAMTALWVRGASYGEIADEWETTVAAARLAVERTLAESLEDNDNRDKQRERLGMQLDAFMKAIMPKALDAKHTDQAGFIRLGLLVAERKAKLYNLDAPAQVFLHMPSDDDLQRWMGAVLTANGQELPEEGDPFALEENPETGVFE